MTPTNPVLAQLDSWRERAAEYRRLGMSCPAGPLLEACIAEIEAALASSTEATLEVREAAALAGVSEETVRRAVRNGDIADTRTNPLGKIGVQPGDVALLKGKARRKPTPAPAGYDAGRHAKRLLAF